jgi:hypothetical protein
MPGDKVRPPAGNRGAERDGINVNSILPSTADILAVRAADILALRAEGSHEKKRRTHRAEGVTS